MVNADTVGHLCKHAEGQRIIEENFNINMHYYYDHSTILKHHNSEF